MTMQVTREKAGALDLNARGCEKASGGHFDRCRSLCAPGLLP